MWMAVASLWMYCQPVKGPNSPWALLANAARPDDDFPETSAERQEAVLPNDGALEPGEPSAIAMSAYYGNMRRRKKGWLTPVMEWLDERHPVHIIFGLNVFFTMLLWFVPQLMPLFLADGFRNPFGFIASGFCCVNPIALINEIFFFYIVTRPYVSWWTRKEFYSLYIGGTVTGALLIALQNTAYMGPTAGSAALLTAFMIRNQDHPIAIWPFVGTAFSMQRVGIVVGLWNLWMFFDNVASSAAFLGGALYAYLHYQRRKRQRGRYGGYRR
jgi:hypothetical protein